MSILTVDFEGRPVEINITYQLRSGTAERWSQVDPILGKSEPGYETDSGKLKIGDGIKRWSQLEYFLVASDVQEMILEALANVGGGDGTSNVALNNHINAPTPHPAYDDAPSLLLLYQNAKV